MTIRQIGAWAIWTGILLLPFAGIIKTAVLVLVFFVGGCLWQPLRHFTQTVLVPLTLKHVNRLSGKVHRGRSGLWGPSGFLAVLMILPAFLNDYWIDVLTLTGVYAVLALGLNLVVGWAGLLDLGYVAFYGIGAYTYALLSVHFEMSFWLGLPVSGLAATFFGLLLGLVTLRLRGDYLAIVTLGFIQIVHLVLNNWDSLTRGPNGILNIGRPVIGGLVLDRPSYFYYLILAICLLALLAVSRLNRSRIGRAWVAIREDETAARMMGIPVTWLKTLAFVLGAFWAGLAGCFFAAKFGFVSPESFTFLESVLVLCMVVIGGLGSLPGVLLGAGLLVILPEVLRGLADYRMLVFGALLVFTMVFRPQGLWPRMRPAILINRQRVSG